MLTPVTVNYKLLISSKIYYLDKLTLFNIHFSLNIISLLPEVDKGPKLNTQVQVLKAEGASTCPKKNALKTILAAESSHKKDLQESCYM